MAKKLKPFSQLSESGKKARLAKYEKERQARGTREALVRAVKPMKFKALKNGDTLGVLRVAEYDKETNETKFYNVNAYIKTGKTALKSFYESIQKGQLLSIEMKENEGYINAYQIIDRSYADKRKTTQTNVGAEIDAEPEMAQA